MFEIRALTEDGHEVTFPCGPNEDVVSAGFRNNIILMSSCREGGCATCKAECDDGDYELGSCSVQALPPDEEEDGMVLLCQTYPRSPLTLKLPYTYDRISFGQVRQSWEADIAICEKVSSNVMRLVIRTIDPVSGDPISVPFFPGQFVDIEVPGQHTSRSYSMATTPGGPELEFFIRLLPGGVFSEFLTTRADIGQRLTFRGPSGAFGLHENGNRPRFFVAGGTGLSPVLSMVRQMGRERHPQPASLLFGVTHEHELFYHRELANLEREIPNLTVHVSVMQATNGWSGARGTVVDALREHLDVVDVSPDIYLCGPPGMIEATMAVGSAWGIPESQIYMEKFLPSG